MSIYDGISQVQVGYGQNRNSKIVRKWSEEQTELFAAVLARKQYKNGEETSWSEELEGLAVKKSSNEYIFKDIQITLEAELEKSQQSHREPGDEVTFTIPQLRAKYKWLKREWKAIQNKIRCGLLGEDTKYPKWFKRLHHIFSVHVDSDRDEDRPSMVLSENGSILNGRSSIEDVSDDGPENSERSWIVNIEPLQSTLPENGEKEQDDLVAENGANDLRLEQGAQSSKRPFQIDDIRSPHAKVRKIDSRLRTLNNQENSTTSYQCGCKSDGERYVEIIKNILNAEERREKMSVDFQREQAQLSREHELKMAQIFVDLAMQQKVLSADISSIKELMLSKDK